MSLPNNSIDRGLDVLLDAVRENPELQAEFVASRPEFFGTRGTPPDPSEATPGTRRHLEWFLLERFSETLGGVPAEALLALLSDCEAGPDAFLNSLNGAFVVTSVQQGQGVWLRDLFGMGEYPVEQPQALGEVVSGDLIAGRLFPVGDGIHCLSPAAGLFRSAEMVEALHRDAERLRDSRRGTMRISQLDLERLFFDSAATSAPALDPVQTRAQLETLLADGRVDPSRVGGMLDALADAARGGQADGVTELLDRLAFDTDVDLEQARRVALEHWSALGPVGSAPSSPGDAGDEGAPREVVAEALTRFDEARQDGADLQQVFRDLESDLGLDSLGEADEVDALPDFPEVVTAMIEEFLWEKGLEEGGDAVETHGCLRLLGRYATAVGVFENLAGSHLLEFIGRWVLDQGSLEDANHARALVHSVSAFSLWCEESQDLPLWTEISPNLEALGASLPRMVELRLQHPPEAVEGTSPYTFRRGPEGDALLVDREGAQHSGPVDPALANLLMDGDVVHARLDSDGGVRIGACYPGAPSGQ